MTPEERVRSAMEEERTVAQRSLRDARQRLRERRQGLHRLRNELESHPERGDVTSHAAVLAVEAMAGHVRFLQDHLRELRSGEEYQRRLQRATSMPAPAHGNEGARAVRRSGYSNALA